MSRSPGDSCAGGVVFAADFSSRKEWVAGLTSAYPDMGPTNRGDHKLDHLVGRYCHGGVFTAVARAGDGLWDCDLLTTEGSMQGFQVRTGDTLDAHVVLPVGLGAWPAIWTWREGGNEIDVFEYHPDRPALLEFSNNISGGHSDWSDPGGRVAPGAVVELRTVFGASSVDWYVNGVLAYADHRGVGRAWHAYLIVNLSVSDGTYHPRPGWGGAGKLSWTCRSLTVTRWGPKQTASSDE